MKLKELLNCVSKNTVVRIVVNHEWVCDTLAGNFDVMKPYYNHCVDQIGIDGDKLVVCLLSESGGIS